MKRLQVVKMATVVLIAGCGGGTSSPPKVTSGVYVVVSYSTSAPACGAVDYPIGYSLTVIVTDTTIQVSHNGSSIGLWTLNGTHFSKSFTNHSVQSDPSTGDSCSADQAVTETGEITDNDAFQIEWKTHTTISNPQNWSGCTFVPGCDQEWKFSASK